MKTVKKKRRLEDFQESVLAASKKILLTQGLEALSMRTIGNAISCSQSKIYEVFNDKNHLCETLCAGFCQILLNRLQEIQEEDPKKNLELVFKETLSFHSDYPNTDSLFTLVCFGGPQFTLPTQFVQIEELFVNALKGLKSPQINSSEKITFALTAIRFLFIGAAQLSVYDSAHAQKYAREALSDLIRGWQH